MNRDLSDRIRDLALEKKIDDIPLWLDKLSASGSKVSRGTHGQKFTHSAIDYKDEYANGVLAKPYGDNSDMVGTHSIANPVIDTFSNAANLTVGVLLDVQEDGETLAQQIASGNSVSFRSFNPKDEQLARWMSGFAEATVERPYVAHALSKQIFFPVGQSYHLISPLHATSLTQAVSDEIQRAKFSDLAKSARAARKANEHFEHESVEYPKLATMKFGGANPQNVSLLNSGRRGTAYLFSCAPPVWREDFLVLPTNGEKAFWHLYNRRVAKIIRQFRKYIASVENFNNARVRNVRASYIDELIGEFLGLGAAIRRTGEPGWSKQSDLSLSEQCFLDPQRIDEVDSLFTTTLDTGEWRRQLADSFGRFINDRLTGIKTRNGNGIRDPGQPESDVWSRELRKTISEMRNQLESLS